MLTQLSGKDFITTEDWTNDELESALEIGDDLKRRFAMGEPHDHILRARTLYMLFFEESTRTRNSFETGITQLGGHAIFLTPSATAGRASVKSTSMNWRAMRARPSFPCRTTWTTRANPWRT